MYKLYIQIYNLNHYVECNARKYAAKQRTCDALFVCCDEVWGKTVHISYCQSTGYHCYMSHNNNAFCRPCLTSFIAQTPKNACDPIEYTLKGVDIEPASQTFAQARRLVAIVDYTPHLRYPRIGCFAYTLG